MAGPRVISSCIDVHWRYTFDGNQCENIYQYAYPEGTTPSAGQLANLASVLMTTIYPAMRACLPNTVVFRELFLRDLHAASGRAQYTLDLAGATGTRGGAATQGNVAANLISRTGFTGRNNHGAKRIGPLTVPDMDRNEMLAGIITALLNLGVQWLIARSAGGIVWTPAVASALTHSRRAITATLMNNNFSDSQKTRLTGHGE